MKVVNDDGGRSAAGYQGKAGDCVTRAIAIATSKPYQEVYDDLARLCQTRHRIRDRKASARNGTPKAVTRKYLTALGWRWTPTMQIAQGCKVHLRAEELPQGRLIVSLSGHYAAVIDGVVHDTHDPTRGGMRCVYGYWQAPENAQAREA